MSAHPISTAAASAFSDLGLGPELLQALVEKGYATPSPIQQQAIPAVLRGHDVMGAAQTGSGKTAGFTLPLLQLLSQGRRAHSRQVRSLVLTPTRELALQVHESVVAYGRHLPLVSDVIFGGVKAGPQIKRLASGVDLLVATPGRLLDLQGQGALDLGAVQLLVLDEADRMLDMGFIRDIQKVMRLLPARRQSLMFSATFSAPIRKLAAGLLHQPLQIEVSPPNRANSQIEHLVHPCDMARKIELLIHLIQQQRWSQVLVFSRTKHGANRVVKKLQDENVEAAAIHSNKSQGARTRALGGFKSGEIKVLVATDIAARGIDIHQLPCVVNLDLPNVAEDYVHRIGRTGRAGEQGYAVSLVAAEEVLLLKAIEKLTGQALRKEPVAGFEPTVLKAEPLDLSGGRGRRPPRSRHPNPSGSGSRPVRRRRSA